MPDEVKHIQLFGRIVITGDIEAKTGLRIGGNPSGIEIGGIDNIVLRNPVSQLPYIPGSSLRGKMRSLYERYEGADINHGIDHVSIHSCHVGNTNYDACNICHIFGVPAPSKEAGAFEPDHPTPLIVRDVDLTSIGGTEVAHLNDYTEVKWEAAIDRITSAAVPRQMERVPAGAVFHPMELIYNVYSADVRQRATEVLVALQLVEDDYLGGLGSRGSGKVRFTGLEITCKRKDNGRYGAVGTRSYPDLETALSDEELEEWVADQIPTEG
jgi:CRISPR-associated protein Csm3